MTALTRKWVECLGALLLALAPAAALCQTESGRIIGSVTDHDPGHRHRRQRAPAP